MNRRDAETQRRKEEWKNYDAVLQTPPAVANPGGGFKGKIDRLL